MAESMAVGQARTPAPVAASPVDRNPAPKLTFASVAAMAPKASEQQPSSKAESKTPKITAARPVSSKAVAPQAGSRQPEVNDASHSFARLQVSGPTNATSESRDRDLSRPISIEAKLDDEKTHLSVSSTKAPSIDGKSVASGATFALDEKESLRPDDSASVAAAEDDDSNSGPGSGDPSSRFGSDNGVRPFQYQLHEISERTGANGVQRPLPFPRRLLSGTTDDARRAVAPIPIACPPVVAVPPDGNVAGPVPPIPAVVSTPDEKLIEALESPRDRMFLLQLEKQFVIFIRDSTETVLTIPPCNSFCRLLAHRLGDYYQLSHFVDNSVSVVSLHKNHNTHLPAPLASFARTSLGSEDQSIPHPSMTIMRRIEASIEQPTTPSGDNTTASSIAPSGPTSDAGDDDQKASGVASPTDSVSTKEKASQTREEREAKYKEVRERIFGDFKEGESAEGSQSNDHSHGASRASSVTGKKKKRNNKTDDDGFQARSAFNLYVPAAARPTGMFDLSTGNMPYFGPQLPAASPQMMQPGFFVPYNQQYPTTPQMQPYQMPMQPPVPMPGSSGIYPQTQQQQFVPFNQGPQQMAGQFYPAMQQQPQMVPQGSNMSSPVMGHAAIPRPQSQMSDPAWAQGAYQSQFPVYNGVPSPYQPQAQPVMPNPQMGNMGPSYPFGQLPFSPDTQTARNAHPVPGSFNRQNLNPQTRSFVPGADQAARMGPPPPNYAFPASFTQQQQQQQQPHPPMMPPMPQQQAPMQPLVTPQVPPYPQTSPTAPARKPNHRHNGNKNNASTPGSPPSSLSKWGTPATLPPKPPPPASSPRAAVAIANGGVSSF